MIRIIALFIVLFSATAAAKKFPSSSSPVRMEARIEALSKFGANPEGGVDRVAYSRADIEGRAYIKDLMEQLGLEVRVDSGGNIIGRRHGTVPGLRPILFGSHIDSVPGGGNYDGDVGVISALEVIDILNAAGHVTRHPLEVVVFSNEEGGLVGSLVMTGALKPNALDVVSHSGLTIRDGIDVLGGDSKRLAAAVVKPGELKAFIELHIEQGAILDEAEIEIGVVEGIVGIRWWDVTIDGFANHAGTTPMNRRRDAMVAAARLTLAVNQVVLEMPGRQVATVGRIRAEPGAPNVIP
ncbi:MAG: Zn-dependent hydrolase, partial [Alphaproteobacteria bacterium]